MLASHPPRRWFVSGGKLATVLRPSNGVVRAPIRAEIFGLERFGQHGARLAQSHRAGKLRFGQATFYPRLRQNMRALRCAYEYVADQLQNGQTLSPAGDWLVENFHLIEDQLREIRAGLPRHYYRSLPVLQEEPLAGLPRIYGVAWSFVAHSDSAFDDALLVHFLNAYQKQRELTQAELWALPTTLRAVLIENLRRLSERLAAHRAAAELAANLADQGSPLELHDLRRTVMALTRRGVERAFVVQLMQSLSRRKSAGHELASPKVLKWLATLLPDLAHTQAQHDADRAADNLSMGNAVTSLRLIGAADWPEIIAKSSLVMQALLQSPVFVAEDAATRDHTLHAIERLSARSAMGEAAVAQVLTAHMRSHQGQQALAQHWLHGPGRVEMDTELGLSRRSSWALWMAHGAARLPAYLTGLMLGATALAWMVHRTGSSPETAGGGSEWVISVLAWLVLWLTASEVVVAVVNRLISESVKPSRLPRFELAQGIPPQERVLVVVPALLSDPVTIAQLIARLQRHHLANPETNTQFALLSDWTDAAQPTAATDDALLGLAVEGIRTLNAIHPRDTASGGERFLLLHRQRSHCTTQQRWMGWERKRGKLEQLVGSLATGSPMPFLALGNIATVASGTRHLMTLDGDTELPPGQLRAIVGVAAHPQNQPQMAADGCQLTSGYTFLQPRVLPPLAVAGQSTAYHWLFAGQGGIDPYSAMASDVYQDFFAEGSFTGKGLINVAAAHVLLGRGRLPEGRILSHDLLEGALARCAVVSDVTLVEADPGQPHVATDRLHRWTRGDWQLLPFLCRPRQWPMAGVNRWKMVDNLRRSLVAPASVLLLVLATLGVGPSLGASLLLVFFAHSAGPLLGAAAGLVPARGGFAWRRYWVAVGIDVLRALAGGVWCISQLLHQALRHVDAIVRTLFRLAITRRQLLAWKTVTLATSPPHSSSIHRCALASQLPLLVMVMGWWLSLTVESLPWIAWALGLAWLLSPLMAWVAGRSPRCIGRHASTAEETELHGIARDTWRLFERVVNASSHHLPPDNLQTSPVDMVAQRTSPTNMGLYLLSAACARQFGWLGTMDLIERLEATLGTMDTLARHRGHFLNWTDTGSLQPLFPRYVSTVDSGNLSGHLLAVAQACRDWAKRPFDPVPTQDALRRCHARMQQMVRPDHPAATRSRLADLEATQRSADRDVQAQAGDQAAGQAAARLRELAQRLERMAWAPDYRFLYHAKRHLFHIGYRVEDHVLDAAFYDLLASESRLTSVVAIAKGDVPAAHWAALGRPYFANGLMAGLRSWSGSMFEYLMPSLVLAEPPGSALHEATRVAVAEQVANWPLRQAPWGMSECAYAERDASLAYQYAPQGVPRLALRRTPMAERVIAPYATALAAQIDATRACANFRVLEALGARGTYGFCDALDFTRSRQTGGSRYTRVQTYMAHHQGMTVVALTNVLFRGLAQAWGMSHPAIEAVQSLLHERPPRMVDVLRSPPPRLPAAATGSRTIGLFQTLRPGESRVPPTLLLSNGRYSVAIRPNGAGHSRWASTDIHRWRDDALRDAYGQFLYVRMGAESRLQSLTLHPAADSRARYSCEFHADRALFNAQWPMLKSQVTVWVSPEDDLELRRVVLENTGDDALELEVIAAFEVTLTPAAADRSHPAFSNLFVKARWQAELQALCFERTPRLPSEQVFHCAQFLSHVDGDVLSVSHQTERLKWRGRNHTPARPLGHVCASNPASGPLVTGLDPVSALGVKLRIQAGGRAVVTFGTAAAPNGETLLAMVDKYRQPSSVERSSVMSATLAGVHPESHATRADAWPALQALTTALLFTLPRPGNADTARAAAFDRRVLWPLALSDAVPLLVVDVSALNGLGLIRTLVHAMNAWTRNHVASDVVVLSAEAYSYHMPLQQALLALLDADRAHPSEEQARARSRLHVHRAQDLSDPQLLALQQVARVRLCADGQSLRMAVATGLHGRNTDPQTSRPAGLDRSRRTRVPSDALSSLPNASQGQFSPEGDRFIFEVGFHVRPNRPWINVLANEGFGALVTEAGGGHTWAVNSRLHQITTWANDPVADPPCEWYLLQDQQSGEIWSISPNAWGAPDVSYRVSHELGSTRVSHRKGDLSVAVVWCVDNETAVKHVRIELTNHGASRRQLRLLGMVEWQMGEHRSDRAYTQTANAPPHGGAGLNSLLSPDPPDPEVLLFCTQMDASAGFGLHTAFFALSEQHATPGAAPPELDWTCNRQEFFDAQGQLVIPDQLRRSCGRGLDPCAAIARRFWLAGGQHCTQVFVLGHAQTQERALELARQVVRGPAPERERKVRQAWRSLLDAEQVLTPDPLFNALVNHWLLYQTVSSRLWAKAGYYQVGGATGFRDQLQDAMALAWTRPDALRTQILRAAARQFEAGDVQHWWHSPGGAGVRTHFSDDLLWLPFAISHHQRATGDGGLLDERVPFLVDLPIPDGSEDRYCAPEATVTLASVYEHAARTLDRSLQAGVHGLPLMGGGDWNDGMNRVGHGGQGESVWLAWFLCALMPDWVDRARQRQDTERADRWGRALLGWRTALDGPALPGAWDGAWYRRAFFDDGTPLGAASQSECQIDLIAQAWSVLCGSAPADRQQQAMESASARLVNPLAGLIQLLSPPLVHGQPFAGYVQAYPPGVRENGGQYTHAGVWALMATACLVRQQRADPEMPYRYFTFLSPAHRASHPTWGPLYGLEPYAVAADVYSRPPYVGVGGWSWYTGAAGWLHRAATESILGLDWRHDTLRVSPCLPGHWHRVELVMVRGGLRMVFILLRADPAALRRELAVPHTRLLPVDQPLAWPALTGLHRFVVPIGP